MVCHGYTSCALCKVPVCPSIGKTEYKDEYKWLHDSIIITEKTKYWDIPLKAYPCNDWLMNVLCTVDNFRIKCGYGTENLAFHKYCYDKLNNVPLNASIFDLLNKVRIDYPSIDLQQSYLVDSLHTDFKKWMCYDPMLNKQNKERIDKVVELISTMTL